MLTYSTIAVTGASGFVGRHIVTELLSRGCRVRALVQNREKARAALPKAGGLTLVTGDARKEDDVTELLSGADACINLIGIIRENRLEKKTFRELHVNVTRRLVHACERLGVKRFVQMSALGAAETGEAEYQRTKFEGEAIVRQSGLAWTIFRPSLIHGLGGEFIEQAASWASGHVAPWIFLPYFRKMTEDKRVPLGSMNESDPLVQPVAVQDVAWAFGESLENSASVGEVYNLAGSEVLSWPQMLEWVRDHTAGSNHRLKPFGIPGKLAALGAKAADLIGLGGLLPHDEGMALMGSQDSIAALDKARTHLKFAPKPFRATFAAYAPQL